MADSLCCTSALEKGLSLAARVDRKYLPVFAGLPPRARAALALYFLPHNSSKPVLQVSRPRVIKWYCPFADQCQFPSGHRYCINVYTGCCHGCTYCYVAGYLGLYPRCKCNFRANLIKDLHALDQHGVPPAPVHLSNSTDPFQRMEQEHRDSLFTLRMLQQYRHRFTTVTLLTKNPAMLLEDEYMRVLQQLRVLSADHPRSRWFKDNARSGLCVECSLAFHDDTSRKLLEPHAPSVASRMEAIQRLRQANIPVCIRIDPLFPRDPLGDGKSMADFGLSDVQPLEDLEQLIRFAKETQVSHVIYSVAKITRPKQGDLSPVMSKMKRVYEHVAPSNKLVWRGGSWRLPAEFAETDIIAPFLQICRQYGIEAKACQANLISTP